MTTPLATGFPDWGRFVSEAQVLEANDVGVVHSGTFVYPLRYVGNGKSIMVWFQPTTQPVRVSFRFYGDPAGTFLMDFYNIDCQTNDRGKQAVPILGPYMDIAVSPSGGGNYTYTLLAWRVATDGEFAGGDGDVIVFNNAGTGIGAGAAITVDCPFVMEGLAYWTAFSASTNWQAVFSSVKFDGTLEQIDLAIGGANALIKGSVFLPPRHIRCVVTNFGAASSFTLNMTRRHNK